jgi:hypothetical protein
MPEPIDDATLQQHLPDYVSQDVVNLSFNRITARGARLLAVAPFTQIRELNLYDNALGPEGAEALVGARWAQDLVALNVCGNQLGAAGARILSGAAWPALERLHIGFDDLGDEGARALASADLPAIHTLNVRLNGIGPRGATALIERFAPQLRVLGIEDNPVGSEGLEALAAAQFDRLEWLNFRETEVGRWDRLRSAPWWPAFVERNGKILVASFEGDLDRCTERLPRTGHRYRRDSRGEGRWAVRFLVWHPPHFRHYVLTGNDWSLGRASFCHISIHRANLSKLHQFLYVRDGQLFVEDAGSTNGSFVNERSIRGPTALTLDDRINYGGGGFCRLTAPPERL